MVRFGEARRGKVRFGTDWQVRVRTGTACYGKVRRGMEKRGRNSPLLIYEHLTHLSLALFRLSGWCSFNRFFVRHSFGFIAPRFPYCMSILQN